MSASSRACRSFSQSRGFSIKDRKSTRLNSSHGYISYAVFCLKKKNNISSPIAEYILEDTLLPSFHPVRLDSLPPRPPVSVTVSRSHTRSLAPPTLALQLSAPR